MEEQTKEFRNEIKRSITCIENLSNEIFYEIFDYLNGFEIYYSFSKINHRFQKLLNSSSLLLKIKLDYSNMQEMIKHKQIDILNKNQIISIHLLIVDGITMIPPLLDISSLNYLQSLVLKTLGPKMLRFVLSKLTGLPNFFSLTIDAAYTLNDLNNIYRLIFSLPKLRYLRFKAREHRDSKITVSLPSATDEQFSTIEYLVIKHPCTFKELFAIFSYTPQVRRFKYYYLGNNDSSLEMISPITLSNLTHISISTSFMTFNKLKLFITKTNCKLRALRVYNLSEDMTYLDAVRWEELILKYLPQLEKFYLDYRVVRYKYNDESPTFYGKLYQFKSPFWIERRWIFHAAIKGSIIAYSIHPYKERWYDNGQHKMINSSDELSKSMQVYLSLDSMKGTIDNLNIGISHIVTVSELYHLEIDGILSIGILNKMLLPFSKLESLHISRLLLSQLNGLSIQEEHALSFISPNNSITKVYIDKINDIEELYCLMELCPRMAYLKVKYIDMDIDSFVRLLATKMMSKSNHHLKLLCFCAAMADDKMVQQLEKTINSEKLFFDYTIDRVLDNIYLQWK